jgi:fibronectin-binding autotransporter adhesin
MSRLNVNSVNPHDGVKVSVTGSTNGGVVISGSGDNVGNPLLAVHGTVSASGNLTASNAFFSGDIHGVGNIYVQGHATLSAYTAGGIQLGDTNTDNVTFGADVNSHIIPNVNNTYDLGSDAQEWRNIYVEGTGYIDTIIQDDSSITNTFKGDSQFIDDAGSVGLFQDSSNGNVGIKTADPNSDFTVFGNISASGQLSVGGKGDTDGHITASGNLIVSGAATFGTATVVINGTAGHITASGNISASGNMSMNGILNSGATLTTHLTASGNVSASGNLIGKNLIASGEITASELLIISTGSSRIQMDGAGNLPTIDNDTVAIFQRNLPGGATAAITVLGHVAGESILKFGDTADEDIGRIRYMHTDDSMDFHTNNIQRLSINNAGNITASADLEILGNISGSSTSTLTIGGLATFGTNTIVLNGTAGHITMSGNISGSSTSSILVGTVTAPSMTTTGTISSSNSIVSANITASNNLTVFGDLVGKGNIALGDNTADKITLIGNVTSSGIMDFTNTTNATDASGDTGALRVEGGISVAQSLFAEHLNATENIKAGAMISSSGILVGKNITASNQLRVDGATGLLGTVQLGDNTADYVRIFGNITQSGIMDVTNTTNATDASGDTGAIRTEGGISVAQDVYSAGTFFATTEGFAASTVHTGFISSSGMLAGQNITASNQLRVDGATGLLGTVTLGNNNADYVRVLGNITSSGILDLTNTTNATDASGDTGALRVEGGASIKQDVYSDGTFFASTEGFAASTEHTGFVSSSGMLVGQNITASRHISGSSTSRLDMQDGYFTRAVHAGAGAGVEAVISSSGNMITNNFTASNNATFNGADSNLMVINPKVSASAEIGALVLHGRHSGSSQANSGGAISTTITEANFPGGTVFGVNQSTAGNAVAFTLPAATAGLEYTFIASVTSGNTTTTISAPSAILKGMAICKDANEDISGTNFIFAATKFEIGTRVTCIADGAIWHVTAICPCDVADVSTT